MERSVQLIVVGGLSLVVGLWVVRLSAFRTTLWLAAVALVLTGALALCVAIARELEAGPLDRI